MTQTITRPKVLLVEGDDDKELSEALLRLLGVPADVQVIPIRGKHDLRARVKAVVNTPGWERVERVGLVVDADANAEGAFKSAVSALESVGIDAPASVGVFGGAGVKAGVLVIPDSSASGALEDLVLASLTADPALQCVEAYINCVEATGLVLKKPSKSRVLAYLASRPDPVPRLGHAAGRGYFPLNDPAFQPLRGFLTDLCS